MFGTVSEMLGPPFSFDNESIAEFKGALLDSSRRNRCEDKEVSLMNGLIDLFSREQNQGPLRYSIAGYSFELETWMTRKLLPEQCALARLFYGYRALECHIHMAMETNSPVTRGFACALINFLIPLMQQYFFKICWLFNSNLLYRQNKRFVDLPLISIRGDQPDIATIPQPLKTEVLLAISKFAVSELANYFISYRGQLTPRTNMAADLDNFLREGEDMISFELEDDKPYFKAAMWLAKLMDCFDICPWSLCEHLKETPHGIAVARLQKLYLALLYRNLFFPSFNREYISTHISGMPSSSRVLRPPAYVATPSTRPSYASVPPAYITSSSSSMTDNSASDPTAEPPPPPYSPT